LTSSTLCYSCKQQAQKAKCENGSKRCTEPRAQYHQSLRYFSAHFTILEGEETDMSDEENNEKNTEMKEEKWSHSLLN
jgi:hypothetical protein